MKQPQLVTNVPIGRLLRAVLRLKVPGTNELLKSEVFSQSPQIQRPTLPSLKLQTSSTESAIHPTSVARSQQYHH